MGAVRESGARTPLTIGAPRPNTVHQGPHGAGSDNIVDSLLQDAEVDECLRSHRPDGTMFTLTICVRRDA